jgi:homoserine O-acetyltransferase
VDTAGRSRYDNPLLIGPAYRLEVAEPVTLQSGAVLARHTIGFETYGTLSPARDNAVLICHSLTKGAHAAGRHHPTDRAPGWWDAAIGPGKMIDTDRYFVICSDTLSAGASTGPASPDPATGKPYGLTFPLPTIKDMAAAQHLLVTELGIERLHAVVGGCFGGMQALEWIISFPGAVDRAVVITTTPSTSPHSIAIFAVMRHLIRADPAWNGGDYYGGERPAVGMGNAIAAALPLWMSPEAVADRFGRRTNGGAPRGYGVLPEFEIEQFIERLAAQAVDGTDPNALMYLTRAVEYFDLEHDYGSLQRAFADVDARMQFVSYQGDWRYPAAETERMHQALLAHGVESRHTVLESDLGHGGFIYDVAGLRPTVEEFLG